jgi:hypothetical protein
VPVTGTAAAVSGSGHSTSTVVCPCWSLILRGGFGAALASSVTLRHTDSSVVGPGGVLWFTTTGGWLWS